MEAVCVTCLCTLQGRLEPRLMGTTTATLVGEGADWRFLGGRAGGGLGRDPSHSIRLGALEHQNTHSPTGRLATCVHTYTWTRTHTHTHTTGYDRM